MFKKAGNGYLIYCDDKSGLLRVATDTPLAMGLKGTFRELTSFSNKEDWQESPYHDQVTDESVLETISWFWTDMEND